MGVKTKNPNGEACEARTVVMVERSLDTGYRAMCADLNANRSERIRDLMKKDLARYLAKK